MADVRVRSRLRRLVAVAGTLVAAAMLAAGSSVAGAVPSRAVEASPSPGTSPAPAPSASAIPAPSPTPAPSATPVPSASPSPSPSPTNLGSISASPSTGLASGQYVRLTLSNLKPGEAMFFRQCIANPVNLNTDCTPANPRVLGRADSSGGGSTYFPVYAYGDDLLTNATRTAKIPCDYLHECTIVAVTNYRNRYSARISFATSPTACPPPGAASLLGSGSAAATRAMFRWSAATCLPPRSLSVGYATHNERDAYRDFNTAATDFGITGLRPAQPAAPAAVSGPSPSPSPPAPSPSPSPSPSAPTYKLAPLTASAVVLAYRAYDTRGTQITNLTLSPDVIAGLFLGKIVSFSTTPAITALNPGISFPPRTDVVARAEYNTETYMFTSWLAAAAPGAWKPPPSESPEIFPVTGIDLKFGEQAAARAIVDPPTGFDSQVFYIGLLDSSTAAFYGLPTARIALPSGSTVAATSDSITKALGDAQASSDGTLVPRWVNAAHPDAYPMPMVTYMIAPTNTIDPAKGDVLAKYLRYAVQDGQALLAEADGYVRLPAGLVQASLGVAGLIPVPAPPPGPAPAPAPAPPSADAPPPMPAVPTLPVLGDDPLPAGSLQPLAAPVPAANAASTGTALPSAACRKGPGAACGPPPDPNSAVAALTYSQGLELAAAAHGELGGRQELVLLALVALTVLLTAGGLGLQLAARLWARRIAGPGA